MQEDSISLFISDIHLSESRNDLVTAFFYFIDKIAPSADQLYILGDLFDFWAGDDIETPLTLSVAKHLSALADRGTEITFIPGNRDFALGRRYAKSAKMEIAPSEIILKQEGILLLHGDELCIDDHDYQRYKRWIRNPLILTLLRHLPKRYRLELAAKIKRKSGQSTARKIMDVNEHYATQYFHKRGVSQMIHGHTHRPAIHHHGNEQYRYVLSDWDITGDYLKLEEGKITRHQFKIADFQSLS